ncbi:MAG: TonB-dependent receptor domain-containing protein [bacterium]
MAQSAPESGDNPIYGEISGKVVDAVSKLPLSDVNISVLSTPYGAASGKDGTFLIRNIPPDKYTLKVSCIGFRPALVEEVEVRPGHLTFREIALHNSAIQFDEVIMTASRKEQTAQMAPASVSIVKSNEIESRNISTFDQAIENVPGISVHRSIGTSVQSLSIRGSSDIAGGGVGNRVLLAIDGRPALRADSGGALWSLVPTNFIDRIEIVKGAFSSLYGSTAMGGVINVITKKPAPGSYLNAEVTAGFYEVPGKSIRYKDSPNLLNTVTLSHSKRLGKAAYLLSLSRKESDGHRQRSAYEFYNLYGKLYIDLSNNRNFEITVGGDIGRNDYPHPWLGNLDPLEVHPKRKDNVQNKLTFSSDIFYYAIPNPRVKYSSRFFFYRTFIKSEFNPNDPQRLIPNNEPFGTFTRTTSMTLGNITQLDYAISERNYLIVGLQMQREMVDSVPVDIMFGNRQVNNFAIYTLNESQLSDKWTLNFGVRYDLNKLVGGKQLTQLSPKVALLFTPFSNWTLRALAGHAFRAPSIAERFFQEEIAGGTKFKPNPELDAEKVLSFEIGSQIRFGSWAELDLAYFHSEQRDLIFWVNISEEENVNYLLFQVRNLNKALNRGLEVSASLYPWRPWRTTFGYTYLDARDLSHNRKDDVLPYKIKHSFSFMTSLEKGSWFLSFDGRYRSAVEEVFLYPNDEPDAFWVVNSKLRRSFGRKLNISLGVNNVFNTQYEELARYRMPGRTWILGSGYQF